MRGEQRFHTVKVLIKKNDRNDAKNSQIEKDVGKKKKKEIFKALCL